MTKTDEERAKETMAQWVKNDAPATSGEEALAPKAEDDEDPDEGDPDSFPDDDEDLATEASIDTADQAEVILRNEVRRCRGNPLAMSTVASKQPVGQGIPKTSEASCFVARSSVQMREQCSGCQCHCIGPRFPDQQSAEFRADGETGGKCCVVRLGRSQCRRVTMDQ